MMDENISQCNGSNADVIFSSEEWSDFSDLIKRGEGKSFIEAFLTPEHDVNNIKFGDHTLLAHASWYGDHSLVKYLIEKGAKPNVKILPEFTLLKLAVAFGQKEIVELLLSLGIPIDVSMSKAFSAMHWSAGKGHASIVSFLIEKGAALDEKDADDFTPLIIAAAKRKRVSVLVLINAGADIYYGTEEYTVLYCALVNGWLEVIRLLSSKGMDFDSEIQGCGIPVLIAARRGKKDIVNFLLEWGVNIHCLDLGNHWSLLHFAVDRKWADVVICVLEKGGDVNAKDQNGKTPLHCACFISEYDRRSTDERVELVVALIKCGADVNAKINSNGATPLDIAYKSPIREILIIINLLKAGADCNCQDMTGMSLFDRFVYDWDIEMLSLSAIFSKVHFNEESNPFFKSRVLQDADLCSAVLETRFNKFDLPSLYTLRNIADCLPSMGNMKISEEGEVCEDIKKSVNQEIQTKGFCNVFNFKSMVLRMITIKALLSYYNEQLKLPEYNFN